MNLSRRTFLAGALATGLAASGTALARHRSPRPRVAAILTEFTYRSHAHVILENFLGPYLFNGERTNPEVDVVSMYVDQFPDNEMAREVAASYGIPIFDTIGNAMTVGSDELAVDAVLSIGEHGDYPVNELGQHEYPRKRFFDEIAAVVEAAGRGIPIFNDKHLSYRWDWALEMVETARRLDMPMLAGSSVPLAQRIPPLEIPEGAEIDEAVSVHGGGVESYDFHGLEVLQSLVEQRDGAETGVAEVQFLSRQQVDETLDTRPQTRNLLLAAMRAEMGESMPPLPELLEGAHGIRLQYVDGLHAYVFKILNSGIRWNFACRLKGESQPLACRFYVGPWNNRNLFKALSHAIQVHFRSGDPPYAVERTLLVTGILDAAMHSRFEGNLALETPHLEFSYAPVDFSAMREMGASWQIITEDTPEPRGLHRAD